jgi:hypothetical protein
MKALKISIHKLNFYLHNALARPGKKFIVVVAGTTR